MGNSDFSNHYMKLALDLAKEAAEKGDVPVGALIVDPSKKSIISKNYNRANIDKDPTLHAELIIIKEACKILNSKILSGCELYVTLEPCAMCAAAISYAQISKVYFGAYDTKFGAIENGPRIFSGNSSLFIPEIYGGIMEQDSAMLLRSFFKKKR